MFDQPGVPLSHYLHNHPDCSVRFTCRTCQASRDVPVAKVVDQLVARGLGGEDTGIGEVARLLRRVCWRCGTLKWETRPGFTVG